jgi:uncharacterized repeat protein (TIGR02543 family)
MRMFFVNQLVIAVFVVMSVFTSCDNEKPQRFTVSFESDGGSVVDDQTVEDGKKATKPADPTLEGHIFEGWYKELALTNLWNFDHDIVNANMTLYAKWVPQMKIRITDIPPEYNGMFGTTFLLVDVDEPVYTRRQVAYSSPTELITNNAVITKLFNSESALENPPHTKKGVYTVIFGIFEEAYGFQILWSETNPINITEEITTISFNDLINIDIRTRSTTD